MKISIFKKTNPKNVYKVGDIVEMQFGIKNQKIVKIVNRHRVETVEPDSLNKRGVGVPIYWIKGKLKKLRLTKH